MSNAGKLTFSVAGALARVYKFNGDLGERFAATVEFWGGSVTVFLDEATFNALLPFAGSADVRVFGQIVKDRSGGFRLSAMAVDYPGCSDWHDVSASELAVGVSFAGTCRVKSEPRQYKRRDGVESWALDVDLFGTSLTFSGFSSSLCAGLTTAQFIQVQGTAEPVAFRGADGKEVSSYKLHLLEVKRLKLKE
ncbi:MAG: hypothetical protein IJQ39_12445 [Thermoguttaceae bacterium]|nr:hypothetical protein [Thermoguttaceae bacterium]